MLALGEKIRVDIDLIGLAVLRFKNGRVFIQTQNPEDWLIRYQMTASANYCAFFIGA